MYANNTGYKEMCMVLVSKQYRTTQPWPNHQKEPCKGWNKPKHATRLQTSRAGNQSVATEDGGLDQGPRSKPQALGDLLWRQTVVTRVQSLLLVSCLAKPAAALMNLTACLESSPRDENAHARKTTLRSPATQAWAVRNSARGCE